MDIKELMKIQNDFDAQHAGRFQWASKVNEENLDILQFLILALVGEVGEFANIVKKVVRGDNSFISSKSDMEGEVTDIFIYLIKICNQMDIDIEKTYLNKLDQNKERFEQYQIEKKD